MTGSNRREFVQGSAGVAAAAWMAPRRAVAASANSQVNVAVIGCGGRGSSASQEYQQQPNVKITRLCDVHQSRLRSLAAHMGVPASHAVDDMRRVFDDPDVDAVYIATPDHWHAPAAILACESGKHVYVEKPCSHNVREGRLLVEAARRNHRVVQHGTQVRSTPCYQQAIQLLRDGIIGDVLVSKAWNIQLRKSIGHDQPTEPPRVLDYDTWIGPAPMIPFQRNRVGEWHWWYSFGTGGIGNDGIHDVDYARWGLGVDTHPSTISAIGGKYFFDDDRQFPDTQQVMFEYPGAGQAGQNRMLIYEQRLWSRNYPSNYNCDSGVEYYGTEGRMFLSRRGKLQVIDGKNKSQSIDLKMTSQDTQAHVADFVDAIRSDRRPNADIEIGHLTASLCHLGNIAARLGRSLRFDPVTEQVLGDDDANALVGRKYRTHWATPSDAQSS